MTYATIKDMVRRFGEEELRLLTACADPSAEVADAAVDRALADASNLIDSYLGKRYALPISPTPAVLVKTACDLARYFLAVDNPTETVKDNHADALKFLSDLGHGRADLNAAGIPAPEAGPGAPSHAGDPRRFVGAAFEGW